MISDLRFSLGRRVRLISFLRHIGEAPRREERSTYLSRAPPQQQPQNPQSVPDQCRWRQVDVPAVPHKLRQAGAATGMTSSSRHAEMVASLPILRNSTA